MAHNNKKIPAPDSDCAKCEYYHSELPDSCIAFCPKPIPADIFNGKQKHRELVTGQGEPGVVFVPKEEYRYASL